MNQTLTAFDMTALLGTDEAINEYASQVLADGDKGEFLRAVSYVTEGYKKTEAFHISRFEP
ncbi:transcriptional regulator [Pseudomonas yamanorum]|nr:transcriptional regulator [Pseudomonas yamanorum]